AVVSRLTVDNADTTALALVTLKTNFVADMACLRPTCNWLVTLPSPRETPLTSLAAAAVTSLNRPARCQGVAAGFATTGDPLMSNVKFVLGNVQTPSPRVASTATDPTTPHVASVLSFRSSNRRANPAAINVEDRTTSWSKLLSVRLGMFLKSAMSGPQRPLVLDQPHRHLPCGRRRRHDDIQHVVIRTEEDIALEPRIDDGRRGVEDAPGGRSDRQIFRSQRHDLVGVDPHDGPANVGERPTAGERRPEPGMSRRVPQDHGGVEQRHRRDHAVGYVHVTHGRVSSCWRIRSRAWGRFSAAGGGARFDAAEAAG